MDGITINDYANGAPGSVLSIELGVDAIQEFSVESANYSAAYGRTSGAVINAITKSGTNLFHGDAYWFLRDEGLDARNFFDAPQIPLFHRNQFGASAGAPIRKNKTFIFGDFEGVRQNLGLTFHDTVPSAAARAGSFCSQPSLSSGTPCTPTSVSVDPQVAKFLQLYPSVNAGLVGKGQGDIGFFNSSGQQVTAENHVVVRVDHHISEKDSLSGSYFYDAAHQTFPDAFLESISANTSGSQMAALEESHIFSSAFVNTIRAGWSRSLAEVSPGVSAINPAASDPSLGLVPGSNAPIVTVPGLTLFPGGLGATSVFDHHQNSTQFYEEAFWTRRAHSLKFGFAFEHIQYNLLGENQPNGNFSFPSLQGFIQNQPLSVTFPDTASVPTTPTGSRQSLWAGYVQDDWRVRSNLTLNLGLRYELTGLPYEAHDQWQVVTNLFTGIPVPSKHLWTTNPTTRDFAPRIGFAYDPFHNGKTSVRGGFGIFDIEPLPWIYTLGTSEGLPFAESVTLTPLPSGVFPSAAFQLAAPSLANSQVRYIEQNPHRSYAMNWNFNVQREITQTATVMVAYVGQHTVHDPFNGIADVVVGTLTPVGLQFPFPIGSGTRLNPNVGTIRGTNFDSEAIYHALDVQVTKRMSRGIQFQVAYNYGKCIDTGSSSSTDSFLNSGTFFFYNTQSRRGLCDFNIGQSLVSSYVWTLPSKNFSSSLLSQVVGGWQLGGLLTLSSGTPFTPIIGGSPLGPNTGTSRPDRLVGGECNNPINPGNPNNYIKVACFTPPVVPSALVGSLPFGCQPAAASVGIANTCMNLVGDAGRNSLIGPGIVDFDFALIKNSYVRKVSETFNVQFRAEIFNLFNRPNFQEPNSSDGNAVILNQNGTNAGAAGVLLSTTTTSRQIQLALKIIW